MEMIPVFINLPLLKYPVTQVMEETLTNHRIQKEDFDSIKTRKMILFLDGYDEIK